MTSIGVELAWLAVRVTVVATLALAFVAWSGRRGARSAVVVLAAAMVILLILSPAAFVPLPDAWKWTGAETARLSETPHTGNEPTDGAVLPPDTESGGMAFLANMVDWLKRSDSDEGSGASTRQLAWRLVTGTYLMGLGIGAVRLLVGWRQLRSLQRRSRAIADPKLLALADDLSGKLHCTQRVELREVDDFGPAATLGWRYPVILLGVEWRGWSAEERHAVLAHELAHVRHRDFLLGLVTSVCRATYFYHPLVRWLAAQMRWRQEVAADDAAASAVGDRPTYLKALARLALRLPARMPAGASVVLPAMTGGILLRRIQMLCRTEQRPMNRTTRSLLLAMLIGTAMLVSTWRGPAQSPNPPDSSVALEPFEVGYFAPEVKGMIAVRPSVWMTQPGMDKVSKKIDELIKEVKKLGYTVPDIIRPENIEQIVANLDIRTTGTGESGSRSVVTGTSSIVVRFHKDVDGPGILRPFLPDMTETRNGNMLLYHLGIVPQLGPMPVFMFQPDRRTMVLVANKKDHAVETHLERVATARQRDWGTGWKDGKQAAFAAVLDNTDGMYSKTHEKDLKELPETKELVDDVRFAFISIELGDGRPMRLVVDSKSAESPKKLEKTALKLLREAIANTKEEAKKGDAAVQVTLRLVTDLLDRREVRTDRSRLEWLVFSPLRVSDFIGADGLPLSASDDAGP